MQAADPSWPLARFLAQSGHDITEIEQILNREFPGLDARAVAEGAIMRGAGTPARADATAVTR